MEKKQSTVINIRLDDETVQRLENLAARENRSRSNLIRNLILEALDGLQDNVQSHPSTANS